MILGQLGFEVFTSWENMLSLSLIGPENMIKWQNCQKKTLLWIQASRPLWMYCKIHTVAYGANLSKLLLIFLGPWISHNPLKTPQKHTETLLTNTMDPNWNPIQTHSISKGFPGNPCGLPSKAQSNVAQTFLSLFFAIPKTYGQPHQNLNRSH